MTNLVKKTMFAAAAVVLAAGVASAQNLKAEIPFAFHAGGQTMTPGTYKVDYVGSQHLVLRLQNLDAGTAVVVLPLTLQDPPKDWKDRGVSAVSFACADSGCQLRELWVNGTPSAYRFKTSEPKGEETRMAYIYFKNDKAD